MQVRGNNLIKEFAGKKKSYNNLDKKWSRTSIKEWRECCWEEWEGGGRGAIYASTAVSCAGERNGSGADRYVRGKSGEGRVVGETGVWERQVCGREKCRKNRYARRKTAKTKEVWKGKSGRDRCRKKRDVEERCVARTDVEGRFVGKDRCVRSKVYTCI